MNSDEESGTESEDGDSINFDNSFECGDNENEKTNLFEILKIADITTELNSLINEITVFTGISQDVCAPILEQFKWDKKALLKKYEKHGEIDQLLSECKILNIGDSENKSGTCQVCFEEDYQLTLLSCAHGFCLDCWQHYLKSKIDEKFWLISCIDPDCKGILTESIMRNLLDDGDEVLEEYKKLVACSFIQSTQLVKPCPGVDCDRFIRANNSEVRGVKCECNESFCVGCGEENHDPISCERLESWLKRCDEDNATKKWMTEKSQKCPKCKVPIEKDGGCDHITCNSCQHQFCWLCLSDWQLIHACNRPENAQNEIASLDDFLHYSRRFMNHRNSLDLQKQLFERVKAKIDSIKTARECTQGEVKFLKDSLCTLADCRRTLMYTYPFAHSLVENNYKTIFEDNQQKLEGAVEELSQLLEKDTGLENFESWKQSVIDKSKNVETRRKALIEHVSEGKSLNYWKFKY